VFVSGSSRIVPWFGVDGAFKGCPNTGSLEYDTYGMAFGPEGALYFTGRPDHAATRLDSDGVWSGTLAGGRSGLSWFIHFDRAGSAVRLLDTGVHPDFPTSGTAGVAYDPFGGLAVVASSPGRRTPRWIVRFDPAGRHERGGLAGCGVAARRRCRGWSGGTDLLRMGRAVRLRAYSDSE
jgi:hypothetical protein